MEKEIQADYNYLFAESDAVRPSSSKSWSTLFNHPDLGGGTSPSSETSTLSLPTQTIRQLNYDDALRVSHSASLSIINPIARSANIQLEEVSVHDEKKNKESPVTSPNLYGTKTKNSNGIDDYFNKFSGKNDDKSAIKTSQTLTNDKFKLKKNEFGIYSKDSKLNNDSKELYKFFMSHNDKPEMSITIHGYHTEEKDGTIRVVNGSNSYDYEKNDVDVVEVTDFDFTIDLSDHILPKGEINTIPSKDDDDYDIKEGKDINQVLEEYCKNNNRSKEIEMRKVIIWDFEKLTKAIAQVIRQQTYYNNIKIHYPLRNNIVK
ncbi:16963_t:CDS:2, partial [Funneliformis geosporum]